MALDAGLEGIDLYHGTWDGAVDSIRTHGLRFVDLDAESTSVAAQFGLDVDRVRSVAAKTGYTEVGHARSTSVSLAGHPIYAARYAGVVGGEARRELYRAVWMIVNGSDNVAASDAWSAQQTRAGRVVVTVRVPVATVLDALGLDRLGRVRGLQLINRERNLRVQERIPAEWVVGVHPVEQALRESDVLREFGRVPSLSEVPSDSPVRHESLWWESTIRRWHDSQSGD